MKLQASLIKPHGAVEKIDLIGGEGQSPAAPRGFGKKEAEAKVIKWLRCRLRPVLLTLAFILNELV